MSIPKEPRQMMINMMYLVLTALLAMNVSAEILNAFHVVNEGIVHSNSGVDSKNGLTLSAFSDQLGKDKDKTQKWYDKAMQLKGYIDALNKQIDEYSDLIVEQSGGWMDKNQVKQLKGWKPELGELSDDKNLEVSTRLMIEEGRAEKLKNAIEDTRAKLIALIDDPAIKKQFESQLPLRIDQPRKNSEGETKTWVEANWHMVPTIACLTLLNKFKNDGKNSEAQLLDYFFGQIYTKSIKVDQMQAKVIAPSSYIIGGQEYKADIFVAAYSTSIKPQVIVGGLNSSATKDENGEFIPTPTNPVSGGSDIEVVNGMGKFTRSASGEGEQKYSGAVMVPNPDGSPMYYPFEAAYTTAKASCIVASDNLNIIYAGIPNPFSVSVPGFSADKVNASVSAGSFTPSGAKGHFNANMPSSLIGKEITVNVTVNNDGKTMSIGTSKFVVKKIPDPKAQINGKMEGGMHTGELKASAGIGAVLQDFYFKGVLFDVISYECVYVAKRQDPKISPMTGAKFNGNVATYIQGCHPGDMFTFRKIKARGPDGTTRDLNSVSIDVL